MSEVPVIPAPARAFYTVAGLAERLSLSRRTVHDMLKRGVIPSYKFEGARRIEPGDVDRYIAARREERAA